MDEQLRPAPEISTTPEGTQGTSTSGGVKDTVSLQPANELAVAIRALRIELSTANDHIAKRFGLKPRDLDVLDIIDQDEPCTPTHLSRRTGIHAATLTGILVRLETAGWIERRTDPTDGRSTSAVATPRFKQLRNVFQDGRSGIETVGHEFTAQQRAMIVTFLKRVTEIVHAEAFTLDGGQAAVDEP